MRLKALLFLQGSALYDVGEAKRVLNSEVDKLGEGQEEGDRETVRALLKLELAVLHGKVSITYHEWTVKKKSMLMIFGT